jgi:hypothetical protein
MGLQMVCHGLEELSRLPWIAVNPEMGQGIGAEQPTPDGSLVVSAIPQGLIATVVSLVLGMIGAKRPQAMGGQQFAPADLDDSALLIGRERTVWQGDGQELIGPQTGIMAGWRVEYVVAVACCVVPKSAKVS